MTTIAHPARAKAVSAPPRSTVSIQVAKEYHKFSAAHFLVFDDGSAERLHGHNYRVSVQIDGSADAHGLVVDFKRFKPVIGQVLELLDERLILPGNHPELTIHPIDDGAVDIRYRERRYVVPAAEIVVLPITNTSAENLAAWIADSLVCSLRFLFPDLVFSGLEVGVEETPGQRGLVRLTF